MRKVLFTDIFAPIEDQRSVRNRRYSLASILGIALLASLSGINSYSGYVEFAEIHYDELKKFLIYPKEALLTILFDVF